METAGYIIIGAIFERITFWAFLLCELFVGAILYPVFGCWVWGGGWLSQVGNTLNLGHGYVDFAGSIRLKWGRRFDLPWTCRSRGYGAALRGHSPVLLPTRRGYAMRCLCVRRDSCGLLGGEQVQVHAGSAGGGA
jgi:Ammonium Transporter Family